MSDKIFQVFQNWIFVFSGFISTFIFSPVILLITFPVFIYRLIVSKILAPHMRPDLGRIVSINGSAMASELLPWKVTSPRCTVLTCLVLEGTVPFQNIMETVETRWINARNEDGQLKYPELQQFMRHWMGFMFWKEETFHLDNHVFLHELSDHISPRDSKTFLDSFLESLLNEGYAPHQSPWDLHVIHNYRDPELVHLTPDKMTALVFRNHHSMADGFSIMYLLIEGFLQTTFSSCAIAQPAKSEEPQLTILRRATNLVKFPYKYLLHVGHALAPFHGITETMPWHIPDKEKAWAHLYLRSPLIPVARVKDIKNNLGVTFTGVILSSISAGVMHSFQSKQKSIKSLPFGITIPVPNHSNTLENSFTVSLLEMSTDPTLDSLERLRETERYLKIGKKSPIPWLVSVMEKVFSCHVTSVAGYLFQNRMTSAGLTNFPGPGVQLQYKGRKILSAYAISGGLLGTMGVLFAVTSYNDHIQIGVTAEKAVLTRNEIEHLIQRICDEIFILHEISLKYKKLNK